MKPPIDPLSDVLRAVRLNGAYFFRLNAHEGWAVDVPHAGELGARVLPSSEGLIPYHIIQSGRCWGGLGEESLQSLEAGDAILFPRGDAHRMRGTPQQRGAVERMAPMPVGGSMVEYGPARPVEASLVCGFLGIDLKPYNPLYQSLPQQLVVRGASRGWIGAFADQVVEESRAAQPGAGSVLSRMAELMFIEVLRRHLETGSLDQGGWFAGMRDPVVGRALASLHADPGRAWTLDELSSAVASSRSNLSERFGRFVGEAPMQYLGRWRMQLASVQLRDTDRKVAAIAYESGYDSEAAFIRAFKKQAGIAPGAWRRRARETGS